MRKICYWDEKKGCQVDRDATPDEVAEIESRKHSAAEINRAIIAELARIDAKSIRAIREGDQERIAAWEAQAQELRAKMVKE